MTKATKTQLYTIGTLDLLAVVFIVLKLFGVITWSWLWVLAPWWIPLTFALGIMIASITVK